MTWTMETSRGFESDKIAHLVVPYTRGLGIDIGCGQKTVWPRAIGVDNGHHFGRGAASIKAEAHKLEMFATESLDYVFSSHLLEHVRDVLETMREWTRVIKPGGHIVLYLPSANLYPKCGQPGGNPDHKRDIYSGDVKRWLLEATNCGWTQIEDEERGKSYEYSLFEVYQKRSDGKFEYRPWQRNPEGKKRVFVIRYGAIGDQIMASSILPQLKKQGYHVTYNTTPDAKEIVRANPYIDEFWLQDRDQVPNEQLGPYWKSLEERFDRIINLSESIEGSLLALPGRLNHDYCHEARKRTMGTVNYWERTHDLAGVPHEFDVRFYPTQDERALAKSERAKIKAPVIVWAVTGSSNHKVYPFLNVVLAWIIEKTNCHVFLTGDPSEAKVLQDAILTTLERDGYDTSRIHPMCGVWKIRECLSFVEFADCIVGPETGTVNAGSMLKMPKVVLLSHSSRENLTKHWTNAYALSPVDCPCWPCHQMHYGWENCVQVKETGAALCASNISPERIFSAIVQKMNLRLKEAA